MYKLYICTSSCYMYILTTFSTSKEEGECVQLAKLESCLQSIDGKGALVPAVQMTHLLSYASIAIHKNLTRIYK